MSAAFTRLAAAVEAAAFAQAFAWMQTLALRMRMQ
jgi:hypothetical protein